MNRRTLIGGVAAASGAGVAAADPASPEAVVDRQLVAYNEGDIDAFVAAYAADAEIYRPLQGNALVMRGHEEIRAGYGPRFATPPGVRAEIRKRIALGDLVTDHEHLPLKDQAAVATYEVRGGLIRRVWLFGPYPAA